MNDADHGPTISRAPIPENVPEDRIYEINMYALDGIEAGYHETWLKIQQAGVPDLIWTPLTGGHWIATRGDVVREVYSDPSRFCSEVIFLPKAAGEKYAMIPAKLDPPEHTPYRQALDRVLNATQVRKLESRVRQMAADLIATFADRGHCDFVTEYSSLFPIHVFMALADLPLSDVPILSKYAEGMTRPTGNTPEEMAESLDSANLGFFAYVEPIIQRRRGGSGDDMITSVVNSKINGEPMPHDKALGEVALLLLAGLDTVVHLLGYAMAYLAQHPDKVAQLGADEGTLRLGVEEIFRRFPVVSAARMVAKDMHYRGVDLKRGDMILVPTALHNLDEAHNANPMDLDFFRSTVSHSTFGGGPHRCAGLHLARLEVMVTLQEWLRRIPSFSLRDGTRPVFHSGIVAAIGNVELVWPAPN